MYIIKGFIVALLFILFCINVKAQSAYGFRIGANLATIEQEFVLVNGSSVVSDNTESVWGLVAGSYVQFDLRGGLGAQVEILYSTKGITIPDLRAPNSETTIQAIYIETPVLLTYEVDWGSSVVPAFHVGPALAFEISERLVDRLEGFEQSQSSQSLRSPDLGLAFGFDVRFDLVSLDALAGFRYTQGLLNLAETEGNEASVRTLAFTIGFLL